MSTARKSCVVGLLALCLTVAGIGLITRAADSGAGAVPPPVLLTAEQDHQRLMDLLGIKQVRRGYDGTNQQSPFFTNYDDSKADSYPSFFTNMPPRHPKLPDPLVMNDGTKVTTPDQWWNKRRPEIVEDFDREIYGRVPANMPNVNWEVLSTTPGTVGNIAVVTERLVGHVDNSSYPQLVVDISLTLTVPATASGPVPVMMIFGGGGGFGGLTAGGFGGARGGAAGGTTQAPRAGGTGRGGLAGGGPAGAATQPGARGFARGGATTQPGARGFAARGPAATQPGALARGGARGRGPGAAGPSAEQQALAKGWGWASIDTNSIQADNGNGLTYGIIGLMNKGQPRNVDDWGALRAWAWGASRALDYFQTDKSVDAKQVGLEGHSRWGKATLVAMAYDPRFAIAYVSSSGQGGAKLYRRNWGEIIENVAGTGEYHWMAGNFIKYSGPLGWDDLPVDSHELIAMCAPRPVFISGGATSGDGWVDAKGMFLAAAAAGPVYRLLGKKDMGTSEFPPMETPLIEGDIAFRQHSQGHTDVPNWPTFFTFADRYIKALAPAAAQP